MDQVLCSSKYTDRCRVSFPLILILSGQIIRRTSLVCVVCARVCVFLFFFF